MSPDADAPARDVGNFVSEWFGHRVYPTVNSSGASLTDAQSKRCPFISLAVQEDRLCIKSAPASGVCTVSSASNGPRQDWLVCPYRALEPTLLNDAVVRLFRLVATDAPLVLPAPSLRNTRLREDLMNLVRGGGRAIVYVQDKLGGEISLSATPRSPELSFDTTLVEVTFQADTFRMEMERYGILELQTMDFHGSYKHAVRNLEDGLRLHGVEFPQALQANPHWLSERVEGPNIANVFKRTFYQMMLKFQIGAHAACVGCAVAIPVSVWDSWQRHLGGPELRNRGAGTWALAVRESLEADHIPGWI